MGPWGPPTPMIVARRAQAGYPRGQGFWPSSGRGFGRITSFLFFAREERKEPPPHGEHAWTRLVSIVGVRSPEISLTPAHLTEPGPA
jgi:hypothetical protein